MTRDEEFERWRERALDRELLEAARDLAGAKLKRAGQEWVGPCPECGHTDTFAINPVKKKWNCRKGNSGGSSVIGMLMHTMQMSFTEACEALTGEPPPRGRARALSPDEIMRRDEERASRLARQQQEQMQEEKAAAARVDNAEYIWSISLPFGGLAAKYLLDRGLPELPAGWTNSLRYHPRLPYDLDRSRSFPCLVSRVDDLAGALTAIWKVFLDPKQGKAQVENAKIGNGVAAGGAVRLGGIARKIGLCEGVETSLGVAALNGFKYPVWAGLSMAGLVNFEVPLGVEHVVIWPDGDQPIRKVDGEYVPQNEGVGIMRAKKAREAIRAIGVKCTIAEPPLPGTDYLDIWNSTKEDLRGAA
jgi:putative DNA primase/helicase